MRARKKPKPKPNASKLCCKCGTGEVPPAEELLAKVCELASMCQERLAPFHESATETRLASEKWNRDLVVTVGTQLRKLRSHVRGLCLKCHFASQTPNARV